MYCMKNWFIPSIFLLSTLVREVSWPIKERVTGKSQFCWLWSQYFGSESQLYHLIAVWHEQVRNSLCLSFLICKTGGNNSVHIRVLTQTKRIDISKVPRTVCVENVVKFYKELYVCFEIWTFFKLEKNTCSRTSGFWLGKLENSVRLWSSEQVYLTTNFPVFSPHLKHNHLKMLPSGGHSKQFQ
jgi:hypothetical protein